MHQSMIHVYSFKWPAYNPGKNIYNKLKKWAEMDWKENWEGKNSGRKNFSTQFKDFPNIS